MDSIDICEILDKLSQDQGDIDIILKSLHEYVPFPITKLTNTMVSNLKIVTFLSENYVGPKKEVNLFALIGNSSYYEFKTIHEKIGKFADIIPKLEPIKIKFTHPKLSFIKKTYKDLDILILKYIEFNPIMSNVNLLNLIHYEKFTPIGVINSSIIEKFTDKLSLEKATEIHFEIDFNKKLLDKTYFCKMTFANFDSNLFQLIVSKEPWLAVVLVERYGRRNIEFVRWYVDFFKSNQRVIYPEPFIFKGQSQEILALFTDCQLYFDLIKYDLRFDKDEEYWSMVFNTLPQFEEQVIRHANLFKELPRFFCKKLIKPIIFWVKIDTSFKFVRYAKTNKMIILMFNNDVLSSKNCLKMLPFINSLNNPIALSLKCVGDSYEFVTPHTNNVIEQSVMEYLSDKKLFSRFGLKIMLDDHLAYGIDLETRKAAFMKMSKYISPIVVYHEKGELYEFVKESCPNISLKSLVITKRRVV